MKPIRQLSCFGLLSVAVVLLGSLALPRRADAAIQRCIGAQGEPVFTEHCPTAVANTPAAMPSAAARRTLAAAPARAGDFCARTPDSLARQVDAALRARNGVRFSGYALWQGMSARSARGETRDLLALLRAASLSVALRPASAFDAEASDASLPMLAVMRMTARGGIAESEELWFRIVRARGCYWLDPQPERRRDDTLAAVVDGTSANTVFASSPD